MAISLDINFIGSPTFPYGCCKLCGKLNVIGSGYNKIFGFITNDKRWK